jgi:outer membrane lipoprotein-sorting protein
MTSGTKTRRPEPPRRSVLALLLAFGVAPGHAQAFDLKALMQRMAQRKSGEARFTEERMVSGIDGPLMSSGTLSFSAPDRFARHTLHPTRESMEVQGRTLLLRRSGRTRQMDMDSVPEVGSLLDALRATLTGDATLLQKYFRTDLSGTDAKWVLRLQPLDERLARQVQQIELVGQAADLRSIELRLNGGDRSLMLLDPVLAPASR